MCNKNNCKTVKYLSDEVTEILSNKLLANFFS